MRNMSYNKVAFWCYIKRQAVGNLQEILMLDTGP